MHGDASRSGWNLNLPTAITGYLQPLRPGGISYFTSECRMPQHVGARRSRHGVFVRAFPDWRDPLRIVADVIRAGIFAIRSWAT
jgi:hypothetical protein